MQLNHEITCANLHAYLAWRCYIQIRHKVGYASMGFSQSRIAKLPRLPRTKRLVRDWGFPFHTRVLPDAVSLLLDGSPAGSLFGATKGCQAARRRLERDWLMSKCTVHPGADNINRPPRTYVITHGYNINASGIRVLARDQYVRWVFSAASQHKDIDGSSAAAETKTVLPL